MDVDIKGVDVNRENADVKKENSSNSKENSETEDKNNEIFKKPMFIGNIRSRKSNLKKYLQQKKCSTDEGNSQSKEDSENENKQIAPDDERNLEDKTKFVPIPYTEPDWKGIPTDEYQIEELKSGVIERTIDLKNKSFICFGRVNSCDICMAHPTVSRFHAVLQYRGIGDSENDKGFYLYDLDSTHGTFLNKYRIKPKVYARVKVGHMIKIGCSTRFFIIKGPADDEEEESSLTVTDMKAQRQAEVEERKRQEEEEILAEEQEKERQERLLEERGISWGMGEDADEETDLSENPYAQITNEELYIDDPKKALRNWFDREGEELSFETEKAEKGLFAAKIILPVDRGDGNEITVEMTGRSKKEAQTQCCLEACRIIDRMGLLRPAKRESKKQQKRNWEENDYYDSDEDSFLDRTGDLDKKREKRMRKAGKIQETVETYDSLMEKHKIILEKIETAEKKLNELMENSNYTPVAPDSTEDLDELDAYMLSLKQKKPHKMDLKIAKDSLNKLQEEETNLRKLINIAKPANMPELILKRNTNVETAPSISKKVEKNYSNEVENNAKNKEKIGPCISEEKSIKVIGPTLPPGRKLNKEIKPKPKDTVKKKAKNKEDGTDRMDDEVYSNCVWKPPSGQTGDGRTALNDKYGY